MHFFLGIFCPLENWLKIVAVFLKSQKRQNVYSGNGVRKSRTLLLLVTLLNTLGTQPSIIYKIVSSFTIEKRMKFFCCWAKKVILLLENVLLTRITFFFCQKVLGCSSKVYVHANMIYWFQCSKYLFQFFLISSTTSIEHWIRNTLERMYQSVKKTKQNKIHICLKPQYQKQKKMKKEKIFIEWFGLLRFGLVWLSVSALMAVGHWPGNGKSAISVEIIQIKIFKWIQQIRF